MPETTRIIDEKRQGLCLDDLDIQSFVGGVASGEVTDAQLGAFTMAVRFNGMSAREQTMMTLAMRDSGIVLDWADVNGPVLDKHSTGGVGDWVSLVLAPLAAAAGAYVPMISGRGLGHTGGTLDKLESIPGFSTQLELAQLRKLVRKNGLAMVGQGPELAPADGRTYAIRDVCATVESVPLIVSSILSKKLAEGLDGLVLDVKTGNGAFMQAIGDSRLLAENLCRTAQQAGIACRALVTDMNQPLGHNAGNALEIREAIDFMTGERRNPNMTDVVVALTSHMLVMG
ncbi:MAG: thymidine phosphorylase, partial [Gammaproteobacteria bacterium]|nr:thymidine phosphorylase [Gammaproteobacteria bacterium]